MKSKNSGGSSPVSRKSKQSAKITAYYAGPYKTKKIRRVLKYNGVKAAEDWAKAHDATHMLADAMRRYKKKLAEIEEAE